jgi:hypothetical protein
MIKCCIGVAVPTVAAAAAVLSEVFVLFVKDIGFEEDGDIVELASVAKGIQAQRITPKTNCKIIISFLLINW